MKEYVFDLETDGLYNEVTKIHCMVVHDINTGETHSFSPANISQGVRLLEEADHLIGHNAINYDIPVLKKLYPNKEFKAKVTDTLVLSRVIYTDIHPEDVKLGEKVPKGLRGRHSLKSWGYRLGFYKGEFGETSDWQTYTPEMLEYCVQDVLLTVKLLAHFNSKEYSPICLELEHKFATIIDRQVKNGFCFDEKAASTLYGELVGLRCKIVDDMQELFPGWWTEMKTPLYFISGRHKADNKTQLTKVIKDTYPVGDLRKKHLGDIEPGPMKTRHTPFNPGSRTHIARVLKEKYNWKPKEYTPKGDPKIDETILKKLKYPEAQVLSHYFLLDKRIGAVAEGNQAWLKLVKAGRIHGSVNTNGAVTGRCTHSHPNVAQVPSVRAPYGKDCRGLFQPRKGWKLVGADASGLELRCLAHYMAYYDDGEYAKIVVDGDIHTENQNAAGLPDREMAKTFIYGFLYGAGDAKIGAIVNGSRKVGETLRERFLLKIPALDKLVKSAKKASKKGFIKGLDGRILTIRYEHAALNTLLQSAGAIIMKQALVNADNELQQKYKPGVDYEFVANVHDEFQLECRPEIANDIGETLVNGIRKCTEDFDFKCPLDGKYKVGDSWAQTH